MKLKTTTKQAFEQVKPTDTCVEFVLKGTESARDLFPLLRQEPKEYTSEKYGFENIFGTDCHFYYRLEKYTTNNLISDTEIGIGCIEKSGDLTLFKRVQSIVYKHRDQEFVPVRLPVDAFRENNPQDYIVLFSHIPTSLSELLILPHSIVVSTENNPINTVTLEQNSILGRLEGDAKSLSISDLSEKTVELLLSYTKQIVLGCSQLDVKKIKTSCLQLKPSNKTGAKEGSIVYNDKTKCIEYYTGSEWRTLTWELSSES
jgi:hypothetical protein